MSAQPRHVAEAMRLGAMGHMLGGAPAAELRRVIDTLMADRRYLAGHALLADLAPALASGLLRSQQEASASSRPPNHGAIGAPCDAS